MSTRAVPSWAAAVVGNYQRMFIERNQRDTLLTKYDIYTIWDDSRGFPDAAAQDAFVLNEMLEEEKRQGLGQL